MKTISHTAQWTAAARAIESQRPDAIFNDPFAKTMADPEGFNLLKSFGGGGLIEFVAIRTKFIDNFITHCVTHNNIRQIVMLACGMDTRAYRLQWPKNCNLYELDYEALHIEKNARLSKFQTQPNINRNTVYTDLNGDWSKPLLKKGFNPNQPTLWVVEALLFFLNITEVQQLLNILTLLSTQGSYMTTDILSAQLLQHPSTQLFLKKLAQQGTPWQFGTDEPEQFLSNHGWQIIDLKEPGEEGAHWGRWPYPVYPKDTPGVPRNWLINAKLAAI